MRIASVFILLFLRFVCFAQFIPVDSLYLGQIPPNNIPKEFYLSVSNGFHAIERITISNDGKSIFYHENNGYDSISTSRMKYYSYINNKWTGPFVLLERSGPPALSVTGDTLYFERDGFAWYLVKNNNIGWSNPYKFNSKIPYWHYLQLTNSGTYYASMKDAVNTVGKNDWCKILINQTDTIITSLGTPINTKKKDLDFYISRNESYIILSSNRTDVMKFGYYDLFISFRKKDNTWTIPQNLGMTINDSTEVRWGPYVSDDRKYLFYSRASKRDYSDAGTNWVRIDNIVDSLKRINNEIKEKK